MRSGAGQRAGLIRGMGKGWGPGPRQQGPSWTGNEAQSTRVIQVTCSAARLPLQQFAFPPRKSKSSLSVVIAGL